MSTWAEEEFGGAALGYRRLNRRLIKLGKTGSGTDSPEQASASRPSPVAKAVRSEHAKDAGRLAEDGLPLHSFRTLLQDLGTLAYNVTHTHLNPEAKIIITTRPTPLQAKAFKLLDLNPACTQ